MTYLNFHLCEGLAEGEHAKLKAEEEEEKVPFIRQYKHHLMLPSHPFLYTPHPRSHFIRIVGLKMRQGSSITAWAPTTIFDIQQFSGTMQYHICICESEPQLSRLNTKSEVSRTVQTRRLIKSLKELPKAAHFKAAKCVCRVTPEWNIGLLNSFPMFTKQCQLAFLKSRNFIIIVSVTNECFPCGEIV